MFSEENKVPRTQLETRMVAGSAKQLHNKLLLFVLKTKVYNNSLVSDDVSFS